jgi:hypothetical protein
MYGGKRLSSLAVKCYSWGREDGFDPESRWWRRSANLDRWEKGRLDVVDEVGEEKKVVVREGA